MSDEVECPECPTGAPSWVVTFADLMSLLMCFFVLLLSFSEMDVLKFKQVAGSMAQAFGVQKLIKTDDIPKGTSIVAQEFSPGKPVPTVLSIIQQMTTNDAKQNLDFTDSETRNNGGKSPPDNELAQQAEQLKKDLQREIRQGMLEIDVLADQVVVRIREKGSFPSGSAEIQRSFIPILNKISRTVNRVDGNIIVAGHTDNRPIATLQYPSNWVLSAARAAAVVHYLNAQGGVDPARMQIRAHADVMPVASNANEADRAKNRRVEIIVADSAQGPVLDKFTQENLLPAVEAAPAAENPAPPAEAQVAPSEPAPNDQNETQPAVEAGP